MAVLTMPKSKPEEEIPQEAAGAPAASERESSLKVYQTEQQLIAKIAAHRNLSVKELFRQKDFLSFLTHALLAELTKETKRLKDRT